MSTSKKEQELLPTPCINVCVLDEQEICIGCFRHIDEIRLWSRSDRETQEKILANIERRKY